MPSYLSSDVKIFSIRYGDHITTGSGRERVEGQLSDENAETQLVSAAGSVPSDRLDRLLVTQCVHGG